MKVKDAIKLFLDTNGYDGLYHPNECACLRDDLFPCESYFGDCEAGYKTECDCHEGCDFHISQNRMKPRQA